MMTIEEAVNRRVDLKEKIDRLTQEVQLIDERLREELHAGNNDVGDYTVQLRANRRLNAERVEARFPVAQYPQYFKATVDLAALKEYLAPVELEQFYDESKPSVVVK